MASDAAVDWRKSVTQSQRNAEVRDISKVLASLEPGSTPNQKLMLSMRFEDQFFKTCKSYEEYRARMLKRLNKLRKNYKHVVASSASASASASSVSGVASSPNGVADVGGGDGGGARVDDDETGRLARGLREEFGGRVAFVLEHAAPALRALEERQGRRGAALLKRHVDCVATWAVESGMVPETHDFYDGVRRRRTGRSDDPRSLAHARDYLSKTVDTVRCSMMKLTDPDAYVDEEMRDLGSRETATPVSWRTVAREVLSEDGGLLSNVASADPEELFRRAMTPVPPLRPDNFARDVEEARPIHLAKLRAAAEALVRRLSLPETTKAVDVDDVVEKIVDHQQRRSRSLRLLPLKDLHRVLVDGVSFLETHPRVPPADVRGNERRVMSYRRPTPRESSSSSSDGDGDDDSSVHQKSKRLRPSPSVVRARVLLSSGRRVSSHLSSALAAKGARHERTGPGARVVIDFRARDDDVDDDDGRRWSMVVRLSPLSARLRRGNDDDDDDDDETLAFASAEATRVLRRCFADLAGPTYHRGQHNNNNNNSSSKGGPRPDHDNDRNEFEIEISETSALLRFVDLAKETYDGPSSTTDGANDAT